MLKSKWAKIAAGFAVVVLLLVISLYRSDVELAELKKKYTNEHSKFLTLEGVEVHYRVEGSGPCLTLLHGTGASLHTWNDWVKELKNDFKIIRLDLPAFGITGPHPDADYSEKRYATFVKEFQEKLGITRCHLAGNSLGGLIAWNYAAEYPQNIDKLILIDAAGYSKKPVFILKLARTPVISTVLSKLTPRFMVSSNLKQVYYDQTKISEELIDRYYMMTRRPGNRQAFIDRAKTVYTKDSPRIKAVKAPTLVMWGQDDAWIPVEHAANFKRDITNSKVIIYDRAGHVPMEEIPQRTARDAREFLKK